MKPDTAYWGLIALILLTATAAGVALIAWG